MRKNEKILTELERFRKSLPHGTQALIAANLKLSNRTVSAVLCGRFKNKAVLLEAIKYKKQYKDELSDIISQMS